MKKCPKCGNELPKESIFCPYCMYEFIERTEYVYNETEKKGRIKFYVMIPISIFLFVVLVFLIVYGNIVRNKTIANENATTYHVGESGENDSDIYADTDTNSESEQITGTIATKPNEKETTKPETTKPNEKETTKSETTKPSEKETTKPETTKPSQSETTKAAENETTKPVEKDTTEATQSQPAECVHDFPEQSCVGYEYCSKCGLMRAPLGHEYDGELCENVTCIRCGLTRYPVMECNYILNRCQAEGPCSRCGKLSFKTHSFDSATGQCKNCGDIRLSDVPKRQPGEKFSNRNISVGEGSWINVTVGSAYKFDVINDKNSKYYGRTVVGIPITHDRSRRGSMSDYYGYIEGYDNKDVWSDNVSQYFNDGFHYEFESGFEGNQQITEYFYFLYNGDGEYKLLFNIEKDVVTENSVIVSINVKKSEELPCSHELMNMYDCNKLTKCRKCGIYMSNNVPHNFDPDTGICENCMDLSLDKVTEVAVGQKFSTNINNNKYSYLTWKNVSVGDNYKFIEEWDSQYNRNVTFVGIPITYDRMACPDNPKDSYSSYIRIYDAKEAKQVHTDYYDDAFQTSFDKGAVQQLQITQYVYFIYTGDGEYKIAFMSEWLVTEDAYVVKVDVKKP